MASKGKVVLGLLVAAALALPVANLVAPEPTATPLSRSLADPAVSAVATSLEAKCAWCHVAGAPRPFYAALPVASTLIEGDVQRGLAALDLAKAFHPDDQSPVAEPVLAKIEFSLQAGEMPPMRFRALHWTGGLAGANLERLAASIGAIRAQRAVDPDLPEALKAAAVRPLPKVARVDWKKAELGQRLYHDKRLSGDDTVSCATCHDLARGGTDQAAVSTGIRGQKGGINAPTTFNSGYQVKQFWDGRAATLEDQADGPPNNPVEMGSNWPQILEKLNQDAEFAATFQARYPEGFSKKTVTNAIAVFERTLLTPDAPFDRYLKGETAALPEPAVRGWHAFQARGCVTCHTGELLGGQSFEKLGVFADYFAARSTPATDADLGRFAHTKNEADRAFFKVPTLRNVARTQPYFHDASAPDLAAAVRTMARFQRGVRLDDVEVADLVAFLDSLTGQYQGKSL